MAPCKDEIKDGYLPVADFYAGKSVFITGGTGFLGKMFIEKLLYSCEKIDKIYVLVRIKHNETPCQRMKKIVDNPIFTRLKKKRPGDLNKIVPILGDITAPFLGIKSEDANTLIENVSVVFHSAATVKFNEPLKVAVAINVDGTRRIIELCHQMKKLEVFVYISTVYSNSNRKVIEELLYPAPADINDVYEYIKQDCDDEQSVNQFLNGLPNTYTFTKALAESLIAENCKDIRTIIVRPSIVISTKNEPVKGWLDNWYGPTGAIAAMSSGLLKIMLGKPDNVVDVIPVDYVSNLSIVAASRCHECENLRIFHASTSSCNPLKCVDFIQLFRDTSEEKGYAISPLFTESETIMKIVTLFIEIIPVYLYELWLRIKGKTPKYVKLYSQACYLRDTIAFFTLHSWRVPAPNARALATSLSETDAKEFSFDPKDINWDEYIPIYTMGVQKYLIKK